MSNEIKISNSVSIIHADGARISRAGTFEVDLASGKEFRHHVIDLADGVWEDINTSPVYTLVGGLYVKSMSGVTLVGIGTQSFYTLLNEGRSLIMVIPWDPSPPLNIYLAGSGGAAVAEYIMWEL